MQSNHNINIAPSASVVPETVIQGDVTIGEESTVLFYTVLRGDEAPISIGNGSNIQENCTVHVEEDFPVFVGNRVTIGHNCVIHGCSIGDGSLIGMNSTIMNGAGIGKNCLIGAGSLVTGGTQIPDGMLALGSPAKVKRALTQKELEELCHSSEHYIQYGKKLKTERKQDA